MNSNQILIEHLKLIEGVIDRLARSSFAVKATASAIAAALIAIVVTQNEAIVGFGALVLVALWALDTYYLSTEKAYRNLYEHVRSVRPTEPNDALFLSLKFSSHDLPEVSWLGTLISRTLTLYHIPLITAVVVVSVISR